MLLLEHTQKQSPIRDRPSGGGKFKCKLFHPINSENLDEVFFFPEGTELEFEVGAGKSYGTGIFKNGDKQILTFVKRSELVLLT